MAETSIKVSLFQSSLATFTLGVSNTADGLRVSLQARVCLFTSFCVVYEVGFSASGRRLSAGDAVSFAVNRTWSTDNVSEPVEAAALAVAAEQNATLNSTEAEVLCATRSVRTRAAFLDSPLLSPNLFGC